MEPKKVDLGKLDAIIEKHKNQKWGLIPLLQDVQETYGFVPPETIEPIAAALKLLIQRARGDYAPDTHPPRRYRLFISPSNTRPPDGGVSALILKRSKCSAITRRQ